MYSNKILNFQESTTILNACTKKSGNLSYAPRIPKKYESRIYYELMMFKKPETIPVIEEHAGKL